MLSTAVAGLLLGLCAQLRGLDLANKRHAEQARRMLSVRVTDPSLSSAAPSGQELWHAPKARDCLATSNRVDFCLFVLFVATSAFLGLFLAGRIIHSLGLSIFCMMRTDDSSSVPPEVDY